VHFEKIASYSLANVLSFSIVVLVCNLNLVRTDCILSTYLGIGVRPYVSDDNSYSVNIRLSSKIPMSVTSNSALEEKAGMDSNVPAGLLELCYIAVTKICCSGVLHVVLPPHLGKVPVALFV